jgi:hypothetical protein
MRVEFAAPFEPLREAPNVGALIANRKWRRSSVVSRKGAA